MAGSYRAGLTIAQVAGRPRVSYGKARGVLHDAGVLRPPGPVPGAARPPAGPALTQWPAACALTRRQAGVLDALFRPQAREVTDQTSPGPAAGTPVLHAAAAAGTPAPASARQIAAALGVSDAAVRYHLGLLYQKFQIPAGPGRRARLASHVLPARARRGSRCPSRSLMTGQPPAPAPAPDDDEPPSLTLVLPAGLDATATLQGLAGAVCRTRADMVSWLETFRQRARACAAGGDQPGEARCRGQVLAAEHVIGHLDENLVDAFSLWDQYDQQIPGTAAGAPAAEPAP
jgi:hypothetical protein